MFKFFWNKLNKSIIDTIAFDFVLQLCVLVVSIELNTQIKCRQSIYSEILCNIFEFLKVNHRVFRIFKVEIEVLHSLNLI